MRIMLPNNVNIECTVEEYSELVSKGLIANTSASNSSSIHTVKLSGNPIGNEEGVQICHGVANVLDNNNHGVWH